MSSSDSSSSDQPSDPLMRAADSASEVPEAATIITELDDAARLKLEVIQSLIEPCDRITYGQRQREGAKKLGISVRSIQRLVKRWGQEGLAGIVNDVRGDKGTHRIDGYWELFIIRTYKEGNKGSKPALSR